MDVEQKETCASCEKKYRIEEVLFCVDDDAYLCKACEETEHQGFPEHKSNTLSAREYKVHLFI